MGPDTKVTNAPELLDVKLVSQITGFAPRTVWRYRDAGFLPAAVKIGSAVRWRRTDIETWIANSCRPVRHAASKRGTSA